MAEILKPIFVDPLDLGAIAASSTAAGSDPSYLNRLDAMGLTWASTGGASWVRGQMSAAAAIDFMSVVSANAQPGTTIRLRLGTTQAQVDGTAPYDSGAIPFISPAITRADGLYNSFLQIPAVQNATWWRIDIAGHTGAFEAAGVVMGKQIEPSRYYDSNYERGIEPKGNLEINRFGVATKQDGIVLRTLMFTLSWINEAEFENTFGPLVEKLGTTSIIYCCFDPQATAWRQRRTYMGWLGQAPYARGGVKPRNVAMEFQIKSLI